MLLFLEFSFVLLADMKEPQTAAGLENLVYQINWIFAICSEIDFNRYFGLLPLVRQGFKTWRIILLQADNLSACIDNSFGFFSCGFNPAHKLGNSST